MRRFVEHWRQQRITRVRPLEGGIDAGLAYNFPFVTCFAGRQSAKFAEALLPKSDKVLQWDAKLGMRARK